MHVATSVDGVIRRKSQDSGGQGLQILIGVALRKLAPSSERMTVESRTAEPALA